MATHTDGKNGGNYGRRFGISRENGTVDKNGRPYFFEWTPSIPAEAGKRKFETRGEGKSYELFAALDGFLVGINTEDKDFGKGIEKWVVLSMIDGDEDYRIEVGQIDGRYALDIMKRLLDTGFAPDQKLRISPYAMEKKEGGYNIGLSAHSGVDGKLVANREAEHLAGMPQPDTVTFKGETKYDFSPVALWLYEQVQTKVCPRLRIEPTAQSEDHPTARKSAEQAPAELPDDLPF